MESDYDASALLPLTAADLRQYVYCPRVVYYRYCVTVRPPPTYKMIEGRLQHERVTELEQRRGLRVYGLSDGERVFDVRLSSPRLGLSGIVDMVILRRHEVAPVEFKHVEPKAKRPSRRKSLAWAGDAARDDAPAEDGEDEPIEDASGPKLVVPLHHKYQLAAYAMMAEERWHLPARRCFVHFVEARRATPVLITGGVRRYTRRLLADMREMVAAQRMPPATRQRGRCVECEYRRFCNDVL